MTDPYNIKDIRLTIRYIEELSPGFKSDLKNDPHEALMYCRITKVKLREEARFNNKDSRRILKILKRLEEIALERFTEVGYIVK